MKGNLVPAKTDEQQPPFCTRTVLRRLRLDPAQEASESGRRETDKEGSATAT